MGVFGFIDDYIKIFKKNKKGLKGRFKVLGQFILGVFVGLVMYFHPDITIRKEKNDQNGSKILVSEKSTLTTIPFLKNNELDYSEIIFGIQGFN